MILDAAGLRAEWPAFIRTAVKRARAQYEKAMAARAR